MSQKRMPNFLIVGTMKSGTTTLASYLSQNKDIHIPDEELHYFNHEYNYQKGPGWYSKQLTQGLQQSDTNLLIGEKTPGYSYLPYCAQRIKDLIPDVKLIWIFRDPVKRAFSNYLHNKKIGAEYRSFTYCVFHEQERMKHDPTKGYIERSKYSDQVERYADLFDLSKMYFMLFEDLVRSPLEEVNRLTLFLGARPFQELEKQHSNRTIMPFSSRSLYIAREIGGEDSQIYNITKKVNSKLSRLWPKKTPQIPNDLVIYLRRELQPYNQRLQELTNLDLGSWSFTAT